MGNFFKILIENWWGILAIVLVALALLLTLSIIFYRSFFKRFYDIVLSGIAILCLSPLFLILIIIGAIVLKGNPFFTQKRPGKNEKIFKLIKFRTMSNKKDENGELLPDEQRLNKYGKILRATSLDELPEIFNIFIGDMSIIGPRPLLVEYLPLYNERQKKRHSVRPGLSGYAQVHGRNLLAWKDKFEYDVVYTENYSFFGDIKIIFQTVLKVFKRDGISSETSVSMEKFTGNEDE